MDLLNFNMIGDASSYEGMSLDYTWYDFENFNRDMELSEEYNDRVNNNENISEDEQAVYNQATARLMQYNTYLENSNINIWERYAQKTQQFANSQADNSQEATDESKIAKEKTDLLAVDLNTSLADAKAPAINGETTSKAEEAVTDSGSKEKESSTLTDNFDTNTPKVVANPVLATTNTPSPLGLNINKETNPLFNTNFYSEYAVKAYNDRWQQNFHYVLGPCNSAFIDAILSYKDIADGLHLEYNPNGVLWRVNAAGEPTYEDLNNYFEQNRVIESTTKQTMKEFQPRVDTSQTANNFLSADTEGVKAVPAITQEPNNAKDGNVGQGSNLGGNPLFDANKDVGVKGVSNSSLPNANSGTDGVVPSNIPKDEEFSLPAMIVEAKRPNGSSIGDKLKQTYDSYQEWLAKLNDDDARFWAQISLESQGIGPDAPGYAEKLQESIQKWKQMQQQVFDDVIGFAGDMKIANSAWGSIKNLVKSAMESAKGNNTAIGRAFQKHAVRDGSAFTGEITGNAARNTEQGMEHLNRILNDPNATFVVRDTKAFGKVLDVRLPDGTGARWSDDGKIFIGLLERFTPE